MARTLVERAALLSQIGQCAEAANVLSSAIEVFRESGARADLERAQVLHCQIAAEAPQRRVPIL
jgi:hypothetical protein